MDLLIIVIAIDSYVIVGSILIHSFCGLRIDLKKKRKKKSRGISTAYVPTDICWVITDLFITSY